MPYTFILNIQNEGKYYSEPKIQNQKSILDKYAKENGFRNPRFFVDMKVLIVFKKTMR